MAERESELISHEIDEGRWENEGGRGIPPIEPRIIPESPIDQARRPLVPTAPKNTNNR